MYKKKSTTIPQESEVANAIRFCFRSVNVADSNHEPANVVDALDKIADAIYELAEAVRSQQPTAPQETHK